VLVLRRFPGHTLAHHILEHLDARAPSPRHMIEAAVLALGDFHTAMLEGPMKQSEDVGRSFRRAAMQLMGVDDADAATREVTQVFATGPRLAKKDAHAGNWLWSSASAGLIVIDVEGATTRPAILELATLIDDLPLFSLDTDGWEQRVGIAKGYVSSLPAHCRTADQDLQFQLEAGVLNVAVTGLARLQRRGWGASSRGIRFAQHQHRHYREVTSYLARAATSDPVRRAAALIGPRD
jgi:hypothetical protein